MAHFDPKAVFSLRSDKNEDFSFYHNVICKNGQLLPPFSAQTRASLYIWRLSKHDKLAGGYENSREVLLRFCVVVLMLLRCSWLHFRCRTKQQLESMPFVCNWIGNLHTREREREREHGKWAWRSCVRFLDAKLISPLSGQTFFLSLSLYAWETKQTSISKCEKQWLTRERRRRSESRSNSRAIKQTRTRRASSRLIFAFAHFVAELLTSATCFVGGNNSCGQKSDAS